MDPRGLTGIGPWYVSFEAAPALRGISTHAPAVVRLAGPLHDWKRVPGAVGFELVALPEDLFFGYEDLDGSPVALAEKAFLDMLWLCERRGWPFDAGDLEGLDDLDAERLNRWAARMGLDVAGALRGPFGPREGWIAAQAERLRGD